MNLFIVLLIIALIVLVVLYIKFRKPKKNTLLCYSGTNGGGKTFNATYDILRFYRTAKRHWRSANRKILPRKKYKEYKGLDMPKIYSNYPIILDNKTLSEPINNDIMFLRKSVPLGSQVIIDEFSSWINQFEFKETFSDTLNDHIQKWRHYHGNDSHFIAIDQCTNNIPLQVRYRLNEAIVCQKTKHYFKCLHFTYYKMIQLCDDIKNVEIIDKDNSDTDDKILRIFRFGIMRRYDDRAYSNRYWYVDKNPKTSKLSTSRLKVDIPISKPMPKEKYPNLDIIIKESKEKGNSQKVKEKEAKQ